MNKPFLGQKPKYGLHDLMKKPENKNDKINKLIVFYVKCIEIRVMGILILL